MDETMVPVSADAALEWAAGAPLQHTASASAGAAIEWAVTAGAA